MASFNTTVETNDRNVSVTKMSQQEWLKCFNKKKQIQRMVTV